jgi:hypothetical protein
MSTLKYLACLGCQLMVEFCSQDDNFFYASNWCIKHETQPITSGLAIMSVAHMPFPNIIATSTNIVLHLIGSLLPCGKKSNNSSPFWMFLHTLFSSKPLLHFTLTSQWTCHLECMTHNLRDSKNDRFACCINFKFRKKPFLVYMVFNG